ncbi:hypothetical protein BDY21DRAFT_365586 [Lineolata rhizophorae]|uniref:Mtf2-like C-terminal domain-containing protein n=1 Tax=Lineolata rhizophorae TaxID=578093 RepID=A0A6A6NVU2_9PEZI|nr:hypothetical protein BDY21DRAFT_365586 [Lineolata rhizophorae]
MRKHQRHRPFKRPLLDEDPVPFEGISEPTHISTAPRPPASRDSAFGALIDDGADKSTITNQERAAFQRLFDWAIARPDRAAAPAQPKPKPKPQQRRAPRGKTAEHDMSEIMAEAFSGEDGGGGPAPSARTRRVRERAGRDAPMRSFPDSLQRMATRAMERMRARGAEERPEGPEAPPRGPATAAADVEAADPMKEMREAEYARVERLLDAAPTDAHLWLVLEREVFSRIRRLDLDGEAARQERRKEKERRRRERRRRKKQGEAVEATDEAGREEAAPASPAPAAGGDADSQLLHDLALIGPSYPTLLLLAIRLLRQRFPSSSLPLSVLPTIKLLGRPAYMLGVSTLLYNEVLAVTWMRRADYAAVDELLRDMDGAGLEFDTRTLGLLDLVRRWDRDVVNGRFGDGLRVAFTMDGPRTAAAKVKSWEEVARKRLEEEALRRASEREREQLGGHLAMAY